MCRTTSGKGTPAVDRALDSAITFSKLSTDREIDNECTHTQVHLIHVHVHVPRLAVHCDVRQSFIHVLNEQGQPQSCPCRLHGTVPARDEESLMLQERC